MTSLYIRAALLLGLVLLLFLGLTSRPRAEGLVIRDERGQYLGRLETNPIRPGERVIRDTRGRVVGKVGK